MQRLKSLCKLCRAAAGLTLNSLFLLTLTVIFYSSAHAAGPTFVCDGTPYPTIGSNPTTIQQMDKVTLAVSTLATLNPSSTINATGYNILDNYIYGLNSRNFMQLASDGTYVMLGQPTGIGASAGVTWAIAVTYAGTMDSSGYWYGHDSNYVYRVYIGGSPSVGSLTFERFARSGSFTGKLADLAFNPLDGNLYGMSGNALRKITIDGVGSTVTTSGSLSGNAGGAWSTSSGTLYFYNNGNGLLYSVDMTQSTPVASFVGNVDKNGTFDATACTPPVLIKSAGDESAEPGDTITYTFKLSNPLSTPVAVEFTDILEPDMSFVAGSLSPAAPGSGTVTTFSDDTLIISNLIIPSGLSPNNEVNFTAQVLINPNLSSSTVISNQAEIAYGVNTTVSDNPGGPIDDATTVTIYLSDWGDAPASYGDAKHVVSDTSTFMGTAPDVETQSQNTANGGTDGTGDDGNGAADEDGVKFPALAQGALANISIDVNQASAKQGYLQAWVDWNGDGDFADTDERIATDLQSGTAGNSTLTLSTLVPASAILTQTFARFRWSTTSGLDSTTAATNGEVEDYAVMIEELRDYSDTPTDGSATPSGNGTTTYGEATHLVIDGIQLGASITGETSTAQDADNASDDGVIAPVLVSGTTQDVIIAASDLTGTGKGTLYAWIDFDGDGAFAAAEHASVAFNNGASGDLSFSGYGTVMNAGSTFARFRLTTDDTLSNTDTATLAVDGEVEDYVITVKPADWGDAPSLMTTIDASLTNPYGDAIHGIDKIHYLGNLIDVDTASQSTGLLADGDDLDGSNDDDGVIFPFIGSTPVLRVDIANVVTVEASADGYLNAWIDYNQDGDWSDTGENIAINQSLSAGSNYLTITPSKTSPHGATYARFRFTSTSVTTPEPTGLLSDGEVEDYRINLLIAAPDPADLCSSVIQNTGFETAPHPSTYLLKPEDEVEGWATIADSPNSGNSFGVRNVIEVWKSGFQGVPAFEGDYFAELNANLPGMLYQDVELTPGSSYTWSFSHRGRSGTDTITVLMGPPDAVVSQGSFSTDNTAWKSYVGTYVVPAGQYITRFAFQATSASSYGNFVDAIKIPGGCDFGDAPNSYATQIIDNGPYHVSNALLYLGTDPGDSEVDGQPTVAADGDNNTGISDEDGISILETLSDVDRSYSVDVVTSNQTGQTARLIAWIDFDGNGIFDADEAAIRSVPTGISNGSITLNWSNIPIDIQAGDSYLRLRLTTESINNREPSGSKWDGEVEDYPITITPRVSVSGRVYIDVNSNATNDTGETGIGGTVITLLDTLTGECRSVATNGSGDYTFSGVIDSSYTLYQAHGESTPVPQSCGTAFANNPTGYQSTTADTLSIAVTGANLTNQDFGEVAGTNSTSSGNTGIGITFEPDHQSEILPGNVKFYAHVFSTEADGSVSFTSYGVSVTSPGWSNTLYNDSNCDGTLDGTEANNPLDGTNLSITGGNRFCIINKVFAPANVTALDSYEVTITADFSYVAGSLPNATLEVTDLTIAAQTVTPTTQTSPQLGESSLELSKTVENLTQASAETSTINQAAAGDVLKYRIYYRNSGTGPITDLKVNDTVPDFTGLISGSSTCDVTPPGLSCAPAATFDQLIWDFTGTLTGGASGYVSYETVLDN